MPSQEYERVIFQRHLASLPNFYRLLRLIHANDVECKDQHRRCCVSIVHAYFSALAIPVCTRQSWKCDAETVELGCGVGRSCLLEFPLSSADHKSPSRSSGLDRSESMLYAGSTSQLNGGGNVYLPDYSVRQLTPLQIIKVPSGCHFSHSSPALTRGSAVSPVTPCSRSPAATTRTQ